MKTMDQKIFLAENLQKLIKEQGLTPAVLAREIGMNYSTLHGYCNGVVPRNIEGLVRLSQRFNASIDDLLSVNLEKKSDSKVSGSNASSSIEGRYEVTIRLMDSDIPNNRNSQPKRT